MVAFRAQEGLYQLGSIRNERLRMLEDGGNCPHGIFPNVCMSVFKARAGGGEERFDQFWFAELAKKTKGVSSDVLVGVLEIVSYTVAFSQSK